MINFFKNILESFFPKKTDYVKNTILEKDLQWENLLTYDGSDQLLKEKEENDFE